MGLDIHVMRPKRFFMREFELPIRQLLPGVPIHVVGVTPMSAMDGDAIEKLLVKTVRTNQLEQETNRYVLPNEDTVVHSARFSYDAFDLLREFAAYQDYPMKRFLCWGARSFGEGYATDDLRSLGIAFRKRRTTYPHLVFHENTRGFYFPTELSSPIKTDFGYIGSTTQLQLELAQLATRAHKALRYREQVRGAIALLQEAIDHAEQSKLPIIFDG